MGNKVEAAENNGEVAYYDGWFYYLNSNNPRKIIFNLYKMRADDTEEAVLFHENVNSFYIADGWIYFTETSDGGAIYKVKTDGTKKVKLYSNEKYIFKNIIVAKGWIYWISVNGTPYGEIFKMRTDGTEQTQFNPPGRISSHACRMAIVNGWVYFLDWRGNVGSGVSWSVGYLCKVRTDWTGYSQICDEIIDFHTVENDWVFYSKISEYGKLYKIRTNGTEETKIIDYGVFSTDISGNWIYYLGPIDYTTHSPNETYKIYKIKTDGTGNEEIGGGTLITVCVVNGWIYCRSVNYSMYRIRTDGTDKQQIAFF